MTTTSERHIEQRGIELSACDYARLASSLGRLEKLSRELDTSAERGAIEYVMLRNECDLLLARYGVSDDREDRRHVLLAHKRPALRLLEQLLGEHRSERGLGRA